MAKLCIYVEFLFSLGATQFRQRNRPGGPADFLCEICSSKFDSESRPPRHLLLNTIPSCSTRQHQAIASTRTLPFSQSRSVKRRQLFIVGSKRERQPLSAMSGAPCAVRSAVAPSTQGLRWSVRLLVLCFLSSSLICMLPPTSAYQQFVLLKHFPVPLPDPIPTSPALFGNPSFGKKLIGLLVYPVASGNQFACDPFTDTPINWPHTSSNPEQPKPTASFKCLLWDPFKLL